MTEPELEQLRQEILSAMWMSAYDHRERMNEDMRAAYPHMLEDCQLQYSRFKFAVAAVLKPRTIYEVGTGWGVSALAFMAGHPEAKFFGIDNGEMSGDVEAALGGLPFQRIASNDLPAFVHPDGEIDLIHIDGGHGLEHKAADIVKAFEARPEWILIDDMSNAMVAAGTFAGIYQAGAHPLRMMYFGDSHTGNLLIHCGRLAPEYRGLQIARV